MFNSNTRLSIFLAKLAETNRTLASDDLIKSYAPNANELNTKKINFEDVLEDYHKIQPMDHKQIQNLITNSTETKKVSTSPKISAIELSHATVMNSAILKLLSHAIKENRTVMDNYRPA